MNFEIITFENKVKINETRNWHFHGFAQAWLLLKTNVHMSDVAHEPLIGLQTLINPVLWDCNTFKTNGLKYTCVHRI